MRSSLLQARYRFVTVAPRTAFNLPRLVAGLNVAPRSRSSADSATPRAGQGDLLDLWAPLHHPKLPKFPLSILAEPVDWSKEENASPSFMVNYARLYDKLSGLPAQGSRAALLRLIAERILLSSKDWFILFEPRDQGPSHTVSSNGELVLRLFSSERRLEAYRQQRSASRALQVVERPPSCILERCVDLKHRNAATQLKVSFNGGVEHDFASFSFTYDQLVLLDALQTLSHDSASSNAISALLSHQFFVSPSALLLPPSRARPLRLFASKDLFLASVLAEGSSSVAFLPSTPGFRSLE
jgi:hypothetical protein